MPSAWRPCGRPRAGWPGRGRPGSSSRRSGEARPPAGMPRADLTGAKGRPGHRRESPLVHDGLHGTHCLRLQANPARDSSFFPAEIRSLLSHRPSPCWAMRTALHDLEEFQVIRFGASTSF
jgi:hypothetical protein